MRGPTSFVNALAQAYLSSSLQTPIMLSTSRLASSRAIVVPIHGISSSRANIAVRRRIIQRCRSTRSGSPPLSSATLHIAAGVAGGGVVILGVSTLRPPHVVDRDAPKSSQYSQYRAHDYYQQTKHTLEKAVEKNRPKAKNILDKTTSQIKQIFGGGR
ncbi:hypothetical protein C8Q72DRAFT_810991 [Fomitopsis betulina]|nr:hypothetical protein C8Q72DRAFT_810991 [Fomitopsis betulina]